jgi:thiamine-phosphate pyrophosphorylase
VKSLYVTDRASVGDERWEEVLASLAAAASEAASAAAGATGGGEVLTVQLRERETSDRETVELAVRARRSLGGGIPLFVNRRFDVALAAGADGVHLPADGLPVPRVRANAPRGFRVGVSTHSAAEVERALDDGADLIVFGPLFATPSKAAFGDPLGPAALAALPAAADREAELYAIGGIGEERIGELLPWRDRFDGIAGIRLFQEAADPGAVLVRIAAI